MYGVIAHFKAGNASLRVKGPRYAYLSFEETQSGQPLMHTWLAQGLHRLLRRSECVLPALQAGLSALKTPQSYQGGCNREDPLHLKVSGCALRRPMHYV